MTDTNTKPADRVEIGYVEHLGASTSKNFPAASQNDYKEFINSFTKEGIAEAEKFKLDEHTKNAVVPENRLKEQGKLLLDYITHPENAPKNKHDPDDLLVKTALLDAAFKIKTPDAPNALHVALDTVSINEPTNEHIKHIIETMAKQATPEQLAEQDRNGKTSVLKAVAKEHAASELKQLSKNTSDSPDPWASTRYEPSQTVKIMIEKMTPEQLAIPDQHGNNVLDIAVAGKMDNVIPLLAAKMNPEDLEKHVENKTFIAAVTKGSTQTKNHAVANPIQKAL